MTSSPEQFPQEASAEHGSTPESAWSLVSPRLVGTIATLVGLIAVAGSYMTSSGRQAPERIRVQARGTVQAPTGGAASAPALVVRSANGPELGRFGLPWTWLGNRGSIVVGGSAGGTGYVAFRALSHRRPRSVRVGDAPSTVIGPLPRTYLAGPIKLSAAEIPIRVSPGAQRASAKDSRRVSVFVSTPLAVRVPFAGLPGDGFYPEERSPVRRFNWMGERGVLDLVRPASMKGAVDVRLVLWSSEQRPVVIDQAHVGTKRVVSLGAGRAEAVVIRGVPMRAGRGRLILTTAGAVSSESDPRRRSLQLLEVTQAR